MVGFQAQSVQLALSAARWGFSPIVYWPNCLKSLVAQPVLLAPVCAWQALSPPGGGALPPPPPPPPPSRGEGSRRRSKDADGWHLESALQGEVLSLWHRGKSDGSRFLNLIQAAKHHGGVLRFHSFQLAPLASNCLPLLPIASNCFPMFALGSKDLFPRSLHRPPAPLTNRGLQLIQPSANPMTGQPLQPNMGIKGCRKPTVHQC